MRKLDLTGQIFGRLTVLSPAPSKNGRARWNCICSCGNERIATTKGLRKGTIKSCGCLISDVLKERNTTHGLSKTRLYFVWHHMKNRCYRPETKQFKDYGGRGIKVCEEWHRFEPFRNWALSHGYRDDLTIDRIDVNGNYCPENCRFVDRKNQNRNRRNNHLLTYNGITLCMAEWAERVGLKRDTLKDRIYSGWPVEKALFTPVRSR